MNVALIFHMLTSELTSEKISKMKKKKKKENHSLKLRMKLVVVITIRMWRRVIQCGMCQRMVKVKLMCTACNLGSAKEPKKNYGELTPRRESTVAALAHKYM